MSALPRFSSPELAKRLIFFPRHFDRREQHLVIASVLIGAVVWLVVYALKLSVHFVFENIIAWTEMAPTQLVIFAPLIVGALITFLLASWRASSVYFRDETGRVHALNDVVGDGLERTIALYYTSEPAYLTARCWACRVCGRAGSCQPSAWRCASLVQRWRRWGWAGPADWKPA